MTADIHACFATVAEGRLRGSVRDGIRRFLSVPYAAPPVGANRFQPPRPADAWDGERDATVAGATPPQSLMSLPGLDVSTSFAPGWVAGDDYLTLNVWRPDDDGENLPVMVYIYGGGFIQGSKDVPILDGTAFARDGVIAIAINYRLGIEGFLPLPGGSTNLGCRDQIAALQWVQRNIRGFGGDPANVTVAGESAGAVSIGCLLASPMAKGLFRRAILQSGVGTGREIGMAPRIAQRAAKILKVSPDAEGFGRVSHQAALKAQTRMALAIMDLRNSNGVEPAFGLSKFIPVYGDDVVPEWPQHAIDKGAGAEVDLLVCTCRDEFNAFMAPLRVRRWMFPRLARLMLGWFHPRAAEALKAYGLGKRGSNSGQVFTDTLSDLSFRWPSRVLAERHRGTAHVMEFDWPSPALGGTLGAAHGIVVPFAFDTLAAATGPRKLLGTNPPQALADRYHGTWVRFVKGEALGWPAFDGTTRAVYSLTRGSAEHERRMAAAEFVPG
jgi:para-nitrobenzyl esterase